MFETMHRKEDDKMGDGHGSGRVGGGEALADMVNAWASIHAVFGGGGTGEESEAGGGGGKGKGGRRRRVTVLYELFNEPFGYDRESQKDEDGLREYMNDMTAIIERAGYVRADVW